MRFEFKPSLRHHEDNHHEENHHDEQHTDKGDERR